MAGTGGQKKVDIIIVTYQRLRLLKIAIKAIKLRTKYPHRLIVIDNNSTDGTREWLKEKKKDGMIDVVVYMKENVGLARGYQEGLKYVKSEYFVVCADDLIPPRLKPCWLEQELKIAKDNSEYGGIAMKGCRISRFEALDEDLKI